MASNIKTSSSWNILKHSYVASTPQMFPKEERPPTEGTWFQDLPADCDSTACAEAQLGKFTTVCGASNNSGGWGSMIWCPHHSLAIRSQCNLSLSSSKAPTSESGVCATSPRPGDVFKHRASEATTLIRVEITSANWLLILAAISLPLISWCYLKDYLLFNKIFPISQKNRDWHVWWGKQ